MLTPEERALLTDIGDKLLDLFVRRDDAVTDGDLDRAQRLHEEIADVAAERRKILRDAGEL